MSAGQPLREEQRWFLSAVMLPPGDGVDAVITPSRRQSAEERLAIYSRSYLARLIECLGDVFPALKRALGEELFNGFAAGYLDRYPSRSYTLARLGDRFPSYFAETRPKDGPDPGWPDLLIDLASLEWAVSEVFDGPGIEHRSTLQADDLLAIAPEKLPRIKLQTSPCLRLLASRFPLNAYYTALRLPGDGAPEPPMPGASYMAVTRRDFVVRRHTLTATQFELLSHLQQRHTLEDAIAHAAETCARGGAAFALDLHEWFRQWARQQFFEAVVL